MQPVNSEERSEMRILLIASTLLFSACQTNMYGPDVPSELAANLKHFEDTVRWYSLENMYVFVKPEEGRPLEIQEGLENVRVTNYESGPVRRIDEEDASRWTQTAVIDYVLVDRQIVRQLVNRQVWESDDKGKTWFLTTPVPQFR
jgi:hypothetical protein